jgi:adenylosuccinate synthase
MATVVLGSQWGDEGKGKLVDILCEDIEVCARSAGGNNAGHTIVANGVSYDFHILPSGQYHPSDLALGAAVLPLTATIFCRPVADFPLLTDKSNYRPCKPQMHEPDRYRNRCPRAFLLR